MSTIVEEPPAPIFSAPAGQCFVKLNDTIAPAEGWQMCGDVKATASFGSCCESNDFCLEDGLCRYTQSRVGGSGYYVAGCTDFQYLDGSCPQLCNSLPVKDAIFVAQPARLWKCCGANADGVSNCDEPTDENFQAKRPERLETYWQAGVGTVVPTSTQNGGPSESSPTGPVTITTSATGTTSADAYEMGEESSISPAVAGGIAAGTAAVVFLVSFLIIMVLKRKRPRRVQEMPGADARAGRRMKSPARDLNSFDSTERSDSTFVHAISEPWPLGNVEKREDGLAGHRSGAPHEQIAWEMPGESARARTPQL